MQNKNSKSEKSIVREAENIIDKYLENREVSSIQRYYKLKEKYLKLRIVTIAVFITFITSMVFSIFF